MISIIVIYIHIFSTKTERAENEVFIGQLLQQKADNKALRKPIIRDLKEIKRGLKHAKDRHLNIPSN